MPKQGVIFRSTGSWYDVRGENQEMIRSRLRGKFKLKGFKVTNPVAVGDLVEYEIENEQENTGLITNILPRENYIIRKSVHKTAHGHIIAANLDQAVLIVTLSFPRTSLGFVDRFLVSAEAFRIPAVLVFNKADLLDKEFQEYYEGLKGLYESLGYTVLQTSALEKYGLEEFEQMLRDKKSLISGHSGVGKSSLINSLRPDLQLRTSEVSSFANKGVHTTTFAEMFEILPNTFIIDTPGIKELGLMDMKVEEISHYFPEMRERFGECKYHNCLHLNEPKCAIRQAVDDGEIAIPRYESYLSMIEDFDNRR